MDTTRLCSILEEVLKAILSQKIPQDYIHMWMYYAGIDHANADPLATKLMQALRSEPELTVFDGTTLHYEGNYAPPLDYMDLATWLTKRAISVGVSQAVENLRTYLTLSEFTAEKTLLVSGLTPKKACELGQGISFISWEELSSTLSNYAA